MRKLFNCTLLLICLACNQYTGGELKPTIAEINADHINMDVLQYNIPKDTTFIITNTGEYSLVIQNVEASCGCTTPTWTKKPIKSGKSGEIKVTYDSKYPGRFHKTITVFTNVEGGVVKLSITGEVKFDEELLGEWKMEDEEGKLVNSIQ